jgi:DNA-binding transcriptional MerR regulator
MDVRSPDSSRGVYGISVAAELTGLGAQTLRLYESRGLLEPDRTDGGTRRYSEDDLDRLRRIGELLGAGLNLAGIRMVLDLQDANAQLERENGQLHTENTALAGRRGRRRQAAPVSRAGNRTAPASPPRERAR